jgi:hypothetical protein
LKTGGPAGIDQPSWKEQFSVKIVKQIKIAGLCLVGVSLAAMLGAAGSAPAAPLLFVPHSGKFPYHLAGTGGEAILETLGGTRVEAASTDVLTLVLSSTLADVHIEFLKAKTGGFFGCGNDGKSETILTNLVAHLGFADPGNKPAELLLVPSGFEFTCAGFVNSLVRGAVIGEITKPALNTASEELSVSFKQAKGEQEFTKFLFGSTTLENQFEESSINGGAFEKSAQSGSATLKALAKEGTFLLVSP